MLVPITQSISSSIQQNVIARVAFVILGSLRTSTQISSDGSVMVSFTFVHSHSHVGRYLGIVMFGTATTLWPYRKNWFNA